MLPIPENVIAQFNVVLTQQQVDKSIHGYYRKWLRYFLDFCYKYPPPEEKSEQVRLIGKADGDLTNGFTVTAKHSWDIEFDVDPLSADRKSVKPSLQFAPLGNEASLASRTTECRPVFLNCEDNRSLKILQAYIAISPDAETVIQYAGGHMVTSLSS